MGNWRWQDGRPLVTSLWLIWRRNVMSCMTFLSHKYCSSLKKDRLTWLLNPKGAFTVASRYEKLLSQWLTRVEVQWWKHIWNNFSWPKCNCFVWTLALNKCLTWDNIWKNDFQGPYMCVMCCTSEEDSSHLFFRYPFVAIVLSLMSTNIRWPPVDEI